MRVKRKLEVCVLSDIHLGTYGCHAKELNEYLNSISPKILVLNGDIIDIWNFKKSYFPKEHLRVIRNLLKMASKGTSVYYLTGYHDEASRRFTNWKLGNIHLRDHLILNLGKMKAWFFHGDIFDHTIHRAKYIEKMGGWGYDVIILLNRIVNKFLERIGRKKYSLSKKIKESVKSAMKFISDFEKAASVIAISKDFQFVICGHIHQPTIQTIKNDHRSILYLNSGDWIENCTALEYQKGSWSLYKHDLFANKTVALQKEDDHLNSVNLTPKELVSKITEEFLNS